MALSHQQAGWSPWLLSLSLPQPSDQSGRPGDELKVGGEQKAGGQNKVRCASGKQVNKQACWEGLGDVPRWLSL
jgi:hypothetical protein